MRIDWWTLALQTVNVLILIWLLARLFFRPVADIIAKRQNEANRLLSDAAAARQEALEVRSDMQKARADIDADRERLVAEAQKAAQTEKENILTQASQETASIRSAAEAAIARERVAADEAIVARASELSVDIARRLLEPLPSRFALSAFLAGLCQELRAMSPEAKQSFSAATADHPIEVVTATPLSGEEIENVRASLTEILGSEIPIAFHSDVALIAGIELRSRSTFVRNTWRADLDRIQAELSRVRHWRKT
jgi:F-type H+-transporting ATPase subunit b